MGCTESKLDNEDTVRRCKERRRLMKAAVHARHHLAAAHSDYTRSLRLTGSALLSFASGEHLSVSDNAPTVLRSSASTRPAPFIPPSPSVHHHPPPPPLSTVSSRTDQMMQPPPSPRRRKPTKVPHILSESSFSMHDRNSTYANTPSLESSVWNWDAFYPPPSPPDSEYFNKLRKNENQDDKYLDDELHDSDHHDNFSSHSHLPDQARKFDERASLFSSHVKRETEDVVMREEVECSEWGDHDDHSVTSSSNSSIIEEVNPNDSASAFEAQSQYGSMGTEKKMKSNLDEELSSVDFGNDHSQGVNTDNPERRMVLRHKNFIEIVSALKDYFDEAASAGDHVSEILELGRDQLDQSFKQLKKRIYHSSGIFCSLSSSWSSKPPLTVRYQFEPKTIEESGGSKSLCSSLDRLLAWENKLYQEVKTREGVKMGHEKKLAALQSQEYRGKDEAELDKTKASIKRLQSLIIVTSQAVSTTSSAIVGLRDSHLIPQLIELCHGFMYMWRSMHQSHEMQKDVVQQVRGLVNRTPELESTSDLHRQATRDLDDAVSAWHSSFSRVIKFHRDFISSINGWFKLTLLPVNSVDMINGETRHIEQVYAFVDEWKLGVDRLPDTVASEAVKSFNNIIRSILLKQSEELKVKKRTDTASKKLEKKASSLREIEYKYYKSYSMVGLAPPPDHSASQILDARDPLAEKKAELTMYRKRVEDEMAKHSKAVEVTRGMTLNNIQTGLPGVFEAMASFSALVTGALETVCKRSYAI